MALDRNRHTDNFGPALPKEQVLLHTVIPSIEEELANLYRQLISSFPSNPDIRLFHVSMCAYFESISQRKLKKLLANPDAIHDIVWSDLHDDENSGFFDLHKSWQALHFLLTGTAWDVDPEVPVSKVVLGGDEVGPDAFGYGPARFIKPDVVKEIAEALKTVDLEELKTKYSKEEFTEANLYSFEAAEFEEEIGILIDYIDGLIEFYGEAADKGNAVLTYIQ